MKDTARRIKKALYGEPVQASRPAGRRISPRLEVIYEIEETETEDRLQQRWAEYACAAAATAAAGSDRKARICLRGGRYRRGAVIGQQETESPRTDSSSI